MVRLWQRMHKIGTRNSTSHGFIPTLKGLRNLVWGFTLIEILIVMAIIVTISLVGYLNLAGKRSGDELKNTAQEMATLLREAQSRSSSQVQGAQWGVHFENSVTTAPFFALFYNAYSAGTRIGYYPLPGDIQYASYSIAKGAFSEIIFAQITGAPSASTSIILSQKGATANNATVFISNSGLVSVSTSTAGGFATIAITGTPTTQRVSAATFINVALPAGIVTGNWIFVLLRVNTSTTISAPAGYNAIAGPTSASGQTSAVYDHLWTSGDPTNVAFTTPTSANIAGIAAAYSGVDQVSPVDAISTSINATSTTQTTASITTTIATDKLLLLYSVSTFPTFSSTSEGTIEATTSLGPSLAWVDYSLIAAGSTGNQTIVISSPNPGIGFQVGLKPAAQ